MIKYYSFFDKIMADSYRNPRFLSFPLHHLNSNYRRADSIYYLFIDFFDNFIYQEYYLKIRMNIMAGKGKPND